eukprot:CAMPEP_0182554662 /NCGR_PEP_ID=MMETSP1323-20130603/50099_1 /TAXON_ID=236787 /ORGANISM="Florenciella parvula, Strain RCC1693" /LENGTH=57 /DNA_ID=CAMNT_0024766387 /DNA_START=534 /DNA_END=707 /DNA_ORIENTATION=+
MPAAVQIANWTLYPSTTVEHTPPPSTHAFTTSAPAFSLAVPAAQLRSARPTSTPSFV